MNWFEQAIADIGNAIEDAVEWVEEAVEDVVEVIVDVVEDIGEALEDVGEAVVEAAGDVVDWTLTVADTLIFDPVDFITGGVIDVDYEDGQLTAEVNIGIASAGVSVGEQGFDAHAGFDIGIASGEISLGSDEGFSMGGSIGIDWGPLPYAEGHMTFGTDGEVSIGGQIQATLPLPGGSIAGQVSGELYRHADGTWGATDTIDVVIDGPFDTGASLHHDDTIELGPDGFSASTSTDVDLDGPLGTGAAFHNDGSVAVGPDGFSASTSTDVDLDGPLGAGAELHADGSVSAGADGFQTDAGFGAGVSGVGGEGVAADGHIGFGVTDEYGNIVTTIEADGGASVGERGIAAGIDIVSARTPDGERSTSVSGEFDATGFDGLSGDGGLPGGGSVVDGGPTGASSNEALVSEPTASMIDPIAESISDLAGTGDLSDAFASGELSVDQAVELVEAETFDDFTSDIVNTEIVEAAADDVWDDFDQ